MSDLLVAPVEFQAAKYAVMHWHYSQKMPSGKLVRHGVWEDGRFIGVVLYGRGANDQLGRPYGLSQTECCELVRIALTKHEAPVSQIVAASLRLLREKNPGLRLIVSFADPEQRHHGGIYQAGNWIYTGISQAQAELLIDGVFTHKRSANAIYGTASIPALRKKLGVSVEPSPVYYKHRYLMPLDRAMRRKVERLRRAAPRPWQDAPAVEASGADAPGPRPGETGAIPVHRSE